MEQNFSFDKEETEIEKEERKEKFIKIIMIIKTPIVSGYRATLNNILWDDFCCL